jgi:hypothetical protein
MEQVKQTAIDWLIEQWPILESQLPPQLIEQAKEMEKEQIIKSFDDGFEEMPYKNGEHYYNENYKSE